MDIKDFFEVHTNDCTNPSLVIEYETEKLVYINQATEKKFQIFQDYEGRKLSDVIPDFPEISGYSNKAQVKNNEFFEHSFFSKRFNAQLRSKTILWEIDGQKYLQTKYFLTSSHEKRQQAENLFERAIAMCLEIMADSTIANPVNSFLELLGKFYNSEHVYLCSFDHEKNLLGNAYFWNVDPSKMEVPRYNEEVPLDSLLKWLETDYSKNIIHLDKDHSKYGDFNITNTILANNNLHNITLCKLWSKDGSMNGILGLNNRVEEMFDDRLLQAVSHFVMEQFNRKSMIETLEDFNDLDLLTGFYNRRKYAEKLLELENNPAENLGVLFVNMNGLRETNEFLGYEKGDIQIKKTSSLLNEYFYCSFYRISGDEFIGFVEDCEQDIFEDTVNSLQDRLKQSTREPAFSLGHSWAEGNYSVTELIKVADAVMLINKQVYFSESFEDMERITNSMLQDLFRGIAEEEFLIYLQPQVNLSNSEIIGAEALIRRYDKKKERMIFPDNFIPVYEENSMIRHVDLYVVRKVCEILTNWKIQGKLLPISVNLSRVTLTEYGIVDTISDILDEFGVDHKYIIIEVTERIGIIENEVASSLVDQFKEKGFKLSLDDFGCAYSNIVTLATVSVDEVKLDKSLVDNILTNQKNAVIVQSMLSMCKQFEGTHTLAEGIETLEQAKFLEAAQCNFGQGYYYSRPIPHEEFYDKYIKN